MTNTTTTETLNWTTHIIRTAVTDAERTVRAREQELANPSYYFQTPETAQVRLDQARAYLARMIAENPDHGTHR